MTASGEAAREREKLRRACEDGERIYRAYMHGEMEDLILRELNRLSGILTLDLQDALGAFDRLLARAEQAEKALRVAGGDFLRIKDRTDNGDGGEASSIAYDSWYRCAVAVPGFDADDAALSSASGTAPAEEEQRSARNDRCPRCDPEGCPNVAAASVPSTAPEETKEK